MVKKIAERLRRGLRHIVNAALQHRPVTLTRDDLQGAVEPHFPVRVEGMLNLVLDQPRVRLDRGRDRIGLELTITPEVFGEALLSSRWLIDGEVSYRRQSGEFFIHKPDLRALSADDRPAGWLRQFLIDELLGSVIPALPLYQLSDGNPRQAVVRKLLRAVHVVDGKVIIHLQLDEEPAR